MGRGEEVSTDYALWYWCIEDYIEGRPSMRTPSEYWDGWDWKELPARFRTAAGLLGYDRDMWDTDDKSDPPLCGKYYGELTGGHKLLAKILAFSKRTWNDDDSGDGSDGAREEEDEVEHQNANELLDWLEPTPASCSAANLLDYNAARWNTHRNPPPRLPGIAPPHPCPTDGGLRTRLRSSLLEGRWQRRGASVAMRNASGFRGVRYFEGREQGRFYWVCSEWMRNQVDWKRYWLEREGGMGVER